MVKVGHLNAPQVRLASKPSPCAVRNQSGYSGFIPTFGSESASRHWHPPLGERLTLPDNAAPFLF